MRPRWDGWLGHVAVALAYAVSYMLLRSMSVSHWNLPAGLRVACLLLVPYRYWPALIVGETIPVTYLGWSNQQDFGWIWASLMSIPPILFSAPAFAWCRRRMPLFHADGRVNMAMALSTILVGALVTALASCATLATMQMPHGQHAPAVTARILLGYFLGGFMGALTLAPAAMALRLWLPGIKTPAAWLAALRGRFVTDCALGVVPPLLLLMWLAFVGNAETMQVCRIAMFLPVAWMTLRHGWPGAAAAGTLASVAVQLTETVVRDPSVIQAQTLIAFAISTLLLLGSRLVPRVETAQHDASDAGDALRGFELAQQGLYQEELRLRQTAEALERIGVSMRDSQKRLLDRLRPVLPDNLEHMYSRHAAITQHEMHRLADALYPRTWRERGVPATFRDGPLLRAASLVGATYECDLAGSALELLAPDVHMMLYRLACETMVYVLAREPVRRIRLQIRGGQTQGRGWVVMRMTCARAVPAHRGKPALEWKQVVSLLGTNGQGMSSIRDRAQIYGGTVHQRDTQDQLCVSLLLHDALRAAPFTSPVMSFQQVASA
ncbi:MASE1 domain-containing protein [Dyella halodurans]|uniref:MASE1 domain-containing protein n=1 Tax=Dyella halodurans TaxID=1920171 RepID=A0ABV9C5H6_9GAMM|nr:MASE1 domain-containing protein [Dyella halodurans]